MLQLAIAPLLLLISASPAPPPSSVVLLLRDGSRIETAGRIDRQGDRLTFRNRAGVLFSIPASEVEREIANQAASPTDSTIVVTVPASEADVPHGKPRLTDVAGRKLNERDKEKLLHEIEKNHSGTPALPPPREAPSPPAAAVARATPRIEDEWAWRREARFHQEAVTRAEEDLVLLEERARRLEDEIRSLTSLGYRARQFSYQLSELVHVREQLEPARLEVTRAQRALDQFMDDARRQDILPGWLR